MQHRSFGSMCVDTSSRSIFIPVSKRLLEAIRVTNFARWQFCSLLESGSLPLSSSASTTTVERVSPARDTRDDQDHEDCDEYG